MSKFSAENKHHKKVSFNEDIISEHDKLRGTRMVIDEPNTPFLRGTAELSDDESEPIADRAMAPGDMMAKALAMHAEYADEERAKHEQFLAKRKMFYNEARVIKGLESPPEFSSSSELP